MRSLAEYLYGSLAVVEDWWHDTMISTGNVSWTSPSPRKGHPSLRISLSSSILQWSSYRNIFLIKEICLEIFILYSFSVHVMHQQHRALNQDWKAESYESTLVGSELRKCHNHNLSSLIIIIFWYHRYYWRFGNIIL